MAILQRAVFVELDYAGLHGMKDYADSATAVLSPHGITVDPVLFARFFSGRTGSSAVAAVLKKAGVAAEAGPLASEILEGCKRSLLRRVPSLKSACAKFAAPLLAQDIFVVFVTQLAEAEAREALGDVVKEGVQVMTEPSQHIGTYGWESWRRLSRRLNVHERLCAAVVGSGLSAKGAVSSGLYAAACIDPLAQHQDFSGVNVFADGIDEALAKEMLRMLWQKA